MAVRRVNFVLVLTGMLLGACAMNSEQPKADSGDKKADTAAPDRKIERSPWQPPAEVDPVPPPVEGGEPAERKQADSPDNKR